MLDGFDFALGEWCCRLEDWGAMGTGCGVHAIEYEGVEMRVKCKGRSKALD